MAGSFTDWFEQQILNTAFGSNTTELSTGHWANLYVGLYSSTATLGDTLTGQSQGECAGSTYDRVAFTNSSSMWSNATGGVKKLKKAITFTTAAGSDWAAIGAFGIFTTASTASTAARCLCWTTLTGGAKTINTGDSITVTTALQITLT